MLALFAVLLSGCRIEVTAQLDLLADGSGTAVLDLELDRELLNLLGDLDLDPVSEVEAAVEQTPEWNLDILVERGDGLRLRLEHEGDDPAGALAELASGLSEEDPGLFSDLEVRSGDDQLELLGSIELAAPVAPGARDEDGEAIGPGQEELRSRMDDHVTGALVVTMPGEIRSHDADLVDGQALRWELPVEQSVDVEATAAAPLWPTERIVVWSAALLVALTVALLAGVLLARRRR